MLKNRGTSCRYMLMWPMFEKFILLIHTERVQALENLWHKSYFITSVQMQNGSRFCKRREAPDHLHLDFKRLLTFSYHENIQKYDQVKLLCDGCKTI